MSDDVLKIDYGDGVSALDRALRSITMVAGNAVQRLTDLGWNRKGISIDIDEASPLPCWVSLRGKRLYEIVIGHDGDRIFIRGEWIDSPRPRGLIDRLLGR